MENVFLYYGPFTDIPRTNWFCILKYLLCILLFYYTALGLANTNVYK